jgi:hypothetical protein
MRSDRGQQPKLRPQALVVCLTSRDDWISACRPVLSGLGSGIGENKTESLVGAVLGDHT